MQSLNHFGAICLTDGSTVIRDWLFRSMMFEADAENFRQAGIRIGADQTDIELKLMEEVLAPFPVSMRNDAMKMTRLYSLIYCFENSVRQLIQERLSEHYETEWWEKGVPKKVREFAEARQSSANGNSWLEGERSDQLQFLQFGHLADIVVQNWDVFADLIPTQHWLKQRMDELEQARNYIAHNRLLMPSEFSRLEQYVADWRKQVGF